MSDSDESTTQVLRGKWMFDGAKTLEEVITRLEEQIDTIKELKKDGWELIGPVEDDYGFLKQTVEHDQA